MGAAQVETDGENITKAGRGERTRQPQADLNQPKAGKCAQGAQASLEAGFTRLYLCHMALKRLL